MYDLIVIGGGPAGLAATAYALDKHLDVRLVCTKLGGKAGDVQTLALQTEPEHILGVKALNEFVGRINSYPECLITDLVISVFKRDDIFHVLCEQSTMHARAVIIATGAQPIMLGIPHEWQLIGRGLGYSAITHAQAVAGRKVAVVGSTIRALRGMAELVQSAQQVTLVAPHQGALDSPLGQRLRGHPSVHIFEGYRVMALESTHNSVDAIIISRKTDLQHIPVTAVFVDLGLIPNAQMAQHVARTNQDGFLIVDKQYQTSLPGMFAAGDVTDAAGEQILAAIGDGGRAAMNAYDYILAQRLHVPPKEMLQPQ